MYHFKHINVALCNLYENCTHFMLYVSLSMMYLRNYLYNAPIDLLTRFEEFCLNVD